MIPFPDRKYNIIYADPPWSFATWSAKGKGKSPERHYPTMSIKEIRSLPVQQIADEHSALFMWATFPCLRQAFDVIDDWGFEYKTCAFTWVKRNKSMNGWFWGMGYWTRSNSEVCLIATKGKPRRVSASVHSVIDAPISRHSQKPDCVRDAIVELMGDLPRIELFARTKTEGWDVWGNEV